MSAEKPASMWQRSRTRLLGDVTERERLAAESREKVHTLKQLRQKQGTPTQVTSRRSQATSRRWQCTARRFDLRYSPGYVCVHAVDHEGAHRDKHDIEWFDE